MTTCMVIELDLQIDNWDLLSANIGIVKNITEPNQL
jgi:hypothetical protein